MFLTSLFVTYIVILIRQSTGITHPSIVAVTDSNAVVDSIKYQQKHCIEKYAFGWSMEYENISWKNTCGTDAFIVAITALVVQGRISIEVLQKVPELMQCVHLVLSGETTHARLLWYSHRESSFSAALKKSSDYSRKHIQHDMQCVIADNIRGCHLLFDLPVKSIATLPCDNKECHRTEEQKK